MSYGFGLIALFLVLGYLFLAVFCPIKSITSKTNLYGIPAGLAFIIIGIIGTLSRFGFYWIPDFRMYYFMYYYSYSPMQDIILIFYTLQYLVFFPLLGIFILSKVNKNVLLVPIVLLTLPYTTSFLNYVEHCNSTEIISYALWLLAYVSLIVLIFARKQLKYAFFVPAVFMLINFFIDYIEYDFHLESIIRYDFWMITGLVLLGAYIVCDYQKKEKVYAAAPAPQPMYTPAPQPVYTNYPPQNSGNNYRQQPQQVDYVQEIAKYKNMLDQGMITNEEYEHMKKKLLGL